MDIKKRWPLVLVCVANIVTAVQMLLPAGSKAYLALSIVLIACTNVVAVFGEKQTRGKYPRERATDRAGTTYRSRSQDDEVTPTKPTPIKFPALLPWLAFAALLAACAASPIRIAKTTISNIGTAVHAGEESWKVADAEKMRQLTDSAESREQAETSLKAWQVNVQSKVNKAFATLGAALIAAARTLKLVEMGLAGTTELVSVARELYAQFQELRTLLTMYDVTFSLPGGL